MDPAAINQAPYSIKGSNRGTNCIAVASVVLLIGVIAGCVVSGYVSTSQHIISSAPQLAHRADTIMLSDINRYYHSLLNVSTCDLTGDFPHTNRLYLVNKENLTEHVFKYDFESVEIEQDISSSTTGLVDYEYMLAGSEFNYTICLGTLSSDNLEGRLFVFNDLPNYQHYTEEPYLGESLSIFSLDLKIGNNNESICMTMSYQVAKPSYYFIAAYTPANIFYNFNYTKLVKYFDRTDYIENCYIYNNEPCQFYIPGDIFSSEEFVLLAYVEPNIEISSEQNHICVAAERSDTIKFIIGLCCALGIIAFIAIYTIIGVKVLVCVRQSKRQGYVTIQSGPPPYDYKTFTSY